MYPGMTQKHSQCNFHLQISSESVRDVNDVKWKRIIVKIVFFATVSLLKIARSTLPHPLGKLFRMCDVGQNFLHIFFAGHVLSDAFHITRVKEDESLFLVKEFFIVMHGF